MTKPHVPNEAQPVEEEIFFTLRPQPPNEFVGSVADIDEESRHVSKANDAIALRVQSGQLSLLARKVFNILVFHAQRLGVPGQNAPAEVRNANEYFWIPVNQLAADVAYKSKDIKTLKETITELSDVKVIQESESLWMSEYLFASLVIHSPGKGGRGRESLLGFLFPPGVRDLVLRPSQFTRLSLLYQSQFRSPITLALYEITRRYLGNPAKRTRREPWAWWYNYLSGSSVDAQSLPEYKYFKNKPLRRAIEEINASTDIQIELIEFKTGKAVSELQFKVEPSSRSLALENKKVIIDMELVDRIVGLGFGQKEAMDILAAYDHDVIAANLNVTEERVARKSGEPVKSPQAYFKTALRQNYASSMVNDNKAESSNKTPTSSMEKLRLNLIAHLTSQAGEEFKRLPETEQNQLISLFEESEQYASLPANVKTAATKGKRSPLWHNTLWSWLAARRYPEPTDEQVLEFAAEQLAGKI